MSVAAQPGTRERNKLLRRERILDAATELLREDRGQALTVERIAERASVVPATVFNLVGTRDEIWAALAHRVVNNVDSQPVSESEPMAHAQRVIDDLTREMISDAQAYQALIGGWSQGARLMSRNPAHVVHEALHVGKRTGAIAPDTDIKRLSVLVGTAFNGAMHQWAAGVIGDRALRDRCRDAIDVAFAAARPDRSPARPEAEASNVVQRS